MNIFDIIRESVQMKDVVKKYRLTVNSSGFAVCPFHSEKTASLKIYNGGRGWHCYGCGSGGSVIDFIIKFFNVDKSGAIKIINNDFALNLPLGRSSTYREREILRRRMKEAEKRLTDERKLFNAEKEEYNRIMDEYVWADIIISALKPKTEHDEIHDVYVEAINKKVIAEYMLDCLGVINK